MSLFRADPGPCIVCGAPHTICTGETVMATAILGAGIDVPPPSVPLATASAVIVAPTPLRAEEIQTTLPPGQFTTATYRRPPRRRR